MSLTTTVAPHPSVNDHQPPDSDNVRAVAMPDASEDEPANPPTRDSSADPAPRAPEIDAAASAPTQPGTMDVPASRAPDIDAAASAPPQPGTMDVPAAMEPTRTSQPDRNVALDPTRTSPPDRPAATDLQPGQLAAADPTRTSQPGQAASPDPTRTSQPIRPASTDPRPDIPATDPTHTSQPGRPVAMGPPHSGRRGGAIPAAIPPQPSVPQPRNPARYHILGEHGRGGLGKVSRAHDLELGRDVAIKELLSRSAMHEVRFMREALITARLEHPGIVPVHEAGRWPDGTPFYAMKLVAGRPLRDLLAERKTIDERLGLLHHVIAVADAIAYAHGRNIIHRDLKPANVIVGDFGETVVIDWGLAKDLSGSEESTTGSTSLPVSRDDGLTSAGTVFGTPAYMAPEQKRGEPVDQRADVYAIGAMLWELCSLEKLPPGDSRQRQRILRQGGIDPDLVAIINKSLNSDPDRRYPDAGALSADLKAFKAGARIGARTYSLFALLTHWTRKRRKVAIAGLAMIGILAAGIALYINNITAERDRADNSEEREKQARASAEASLDALTLKHAQLLLATDPSAAIDALATYHGTEIERASQIRAEATGRGTSLLRATPHNGMIRWLERTSDGSIISLAGDGTIAQTTSDGKTTILMRGVARFAQLAYSRTRCLLAYACDPSSLCIYDVSRSTQIATAPIFRDIHVAGLSFSHDGTALAVMSQDTTLRVLDLTNPSEPQIHLTKKISGGADVTFYLRDTIVAGTLDGVEFVHTNGHSESFQIKYNSFWDVDATKGRFALATIHGQAFLFTGSPIRITAQSTLCHGPIVGLHFLPTQGGIAYGCREGAIGIWDAESNTTTLLTRVEGYADLVNVSETGDYVTAASANGTITIYDLQTHLTSSLKGHGTRISAITLLTSEQSFLLSGDVSGKIRTWSMPPRFARVATILDSQLNTAIFDENSATIVATTYLPVLTTFSEHSGVRSHGPHEPHNISLVKSGNGHTFATYGLRETIELWSFQTMTRIRTINTNQGSVTQLSFVGNSDELITSGHDGRLIQWKPSGEASVITQIDQPIESFLLLSTQDAKVKGTMVFGSVDGTLWRASWHAGTKVAASSLLRRNARITRLLAAPGKSLIFVGYADGQVLTVNTDTWEHSTILRSTGSVREISLTPSAEWVAIATNDSSVHVGAVRNLLPATGRMSWTKLSIQVRHQFLTPDGLLIAVCNDGTIRIYSILQHNWLYLPIGAADLRWVTASANGENAVALDVEGRIIWLDLNSVRKLFSEHIKQQPKHTQQQGSHKP